MVLFGFLEQYKEAKMRKLKAKTYHDLEKVTRINGGQGENKDLHICPDKTFKEKRNYLNIKALNNAAACYFMLFIAVTLCLLS